jgi:hypothetical protein
MGVAGSKETEVRFRQNVRCMGYVLTFWLERKLKGRLGYLSLQMFTAMQRRVSI